MRSQSSLHSFFGGGNLSWGDVLPSGKNGVSRKRLPLHHSIKTSERVRIALFQSDKYDVPRKDLCVILGISHSALQGLINGTLAKAKADALIAVIESWPRRSEGNADRLANKSLHNKLMAANRRNN